MYKSNTLKDRGHPLTASHTQCHDTPLHFATRHGVGLGDVATRWVIDRPQVASAIMGFTSTRHLPATQRIEALRLDAQDHALLAPLLARRTGPAGDCYDIERDKEGRHGRIMRYNQNEGRH